VTELENSVSQCNACIFELDGIRREVSRRTHQINLQTQGDISRWLSPLKIKTVWREAQLKVTEHSRILCQEGLELA
jgi:hypothetical protein